MRTHLALATRDLAASVAFYRTLLGAEPVKRFDAYALFISDRPPLELALTGDPGATAGRDDHFGIVVDDDPAVATAIARLRAAALPVDVETATTCCYAVQTKVWATDPDGRRWETYVVLEERDARDGDACDGDDDACCAA